MESKVILGDSKFIFYDMYIFRIFEKLDEIKTNQYRGWNPYFATK